MQTSMGKREATDLLINLAENVAALIDVAREQGVSNDEALGVLGILIFAGTDTPEGRIVLDLQHGDDRMVLTILPETEVEEGCQCGCEC